MSKKPKIDKTMPGKGKSVQLLIPCLVDQLYPEIGIATTNILQHFGYTVQYAPEIVCCGQPAFNAGHRDEARKVAEVCLKSLSAAKDCHAIVCPSGSCTAMVKKFYPLLFTEPEWKETLQQVVSKTFEFAEFLNKEGLAGEQGKALQGEKGQACGFHNSCHSYRELRLKTEGKSALACLGNCEVSEPSEEPSCCGFGGLFSVKFETVASGMAKSRIEKFLDTGNKNIVSNDPGCIMHMRNESLRHGLSTEIDHLSIPIARSLGLPIDSFSSPEE